MINVQTPAGRPRRQRGMVLINDEQLADLIALPHGQHVTAFEVQSLTASIALLVEGPGLPACEPGAAPTMINTLWAIGRLPYVATTDPAEIHVALLKVVDDHGRLEGTLLRAARRRILERHKPGAPRARKPGVPDTAWCANRTCADAHVFWPCPDYRDAAEGIAIVGYFDPVAVDAFLFGRRGDQ